MQRKDIARNRRQLKVRNSKARRTLNFQDNSSEEPSRGGMKRVREEHAQQDCPNIARDVLPEPSQKKARMITKTPVQSPQISPRDNQVNLDQLVQSFASFGMFTGSGRSEMRTPFSTPESSPKKKK